MNSRLRSKAKKFGLQLLSLTEHKLMKNKSREILENLKGLVVTRKVHLASVVIESIIAFRRKLIMLSTRINPNDYDKIFQFI